MVKAQKKKDGGIVHRNSSSYAYLLLCTVLIAVAQLTLKMGVSRLEPSVSGFFNDAPLIIGAVLYLLTALFFVHVLKKIELSIAYPIMSLSFVWVAILSIIFLKESLGLFGWLGIILVMAGVSAIGRGNK